MPPKAKSGTTSSASATSKSPALAPRPAQTNPKTGSASSTAPAVRSSATGPDTPIQYIKGVGPRLGSIFEQRGISTAKDILTFFPRSYEDRSRLVRVSELQDGTSATVSLQVVSARAIPTRTGKSILEVRCTDGSATVSLKWFHAPRGMEKRFQVGTQFVATGKVKLFMSRPEMVHPEITWGVSGAAGPLLSSSASQSTPPNEEQGPDIGRVVPIYTEIEGIPSRTLRKVLWEACEKYAPLLTEDLPQKYITQHQLPLLREAVRAIHFPPLDESKSADQNQAAIQDLIQFNTPWHWRLVYEEFFKFEWLVLRQRLRMERYFAPTIGKEGGQSAAKELEKNLPFALTDDQKKVIQEILHDISQGHPMNRLVQGDVGSGKTAVAFLAAGAALAEGGQVVLMAPTEILAEQHFKNAAKLFEGKLNCALLTGKTTQAERNKLLPRLAAGEPLLLIGTHAILEDPVVFKNLTLTLIDEQQRFGVEQRRTLRSKGVYRHDDQSPRMIPHSLVLSATPIPRTLALTAYGDLSVSTIRQMPAGRSPIVTKVIRGDARVAAYEKIREEIRKGHQAYFIFPLVNESEAEGFTHLKSAVQEAEHLGTEVFPEFKVEVLHGQMKADEKQAIMDRFKKNETQILVSTTVVEVGVDVPNATVMAVEHADRFGLSQLHQLRGRVGRGAAQSYCYFFAAKQTAEITGMRLDVLEQTTDGFEIAEADLKIRGPGDFLGTRQAGTLPFRLADLVRDREWLLKARDDAQAVLKSDPELQSPENARLRRYFEREGKLQSERLKTS
jgi:ATP-dependent DNA helicase RecG